MTTNESRADILWGFLRRRGVGALSHIVERLNEGHAQKDVAREIGMDAGQFSRFVHAVLVTEVHVDPDIQDMIDLFQQMEARNAERVKGYVLNLGERARRAANGDTGGDGSGVPGAAWLPALLFVDYCIHLGIECVHCFIV